MISYPTSKPPSNLTGVSKALNTSRGSIIRGHQHHQRDIDQRCVIYIHLSPLSFHQPASLLESTY
eukprot:scaffold37517_cov128-Skeletonema_dohrnii-CCMP3373.AAC.1